MFVLDPSLSARLLGAGALILAGLLSAATATAVDSAAETDNTAEMKRHGRAAAEYTEKATRNAWLDGKLEAALLFNRHLNNFTIDTRVQGEVAYLSGTVDSAIGRELAEQVALGIDGIERVENDLEVDAELARDQHPEDRDRTFAQRVDDLTTRAAVKSQLLMNDSTDGLDIEVETRDGRVTLSGHVASAEEKELAGRIAANTEGVASVRNRLRIRENG